MTKLLVGLSLAVWSLFAQAQPMSSQCGSSWSAWERFQTHFISHDGRVIDGSDPRKITTSEGQSYALFFALVNNNQPLFHKLLEWTQTHLAQGDLGANLPAWLWGRTPENTWGILDSNSAADSDLWIAYSLLEAGRLWEVREYTLLAHLLLQNIAQQETTRMPNFGPVLLPAPYGFKQTSAWRLNPSYVPPQLIERVRTERSTSPIWADLAKRLPAFLMQSAPLGIAPDWVQWDGKAWSWEADEMASYDAIRVYLWVGMLHASAPSAVELKTHFSAALAFMNNKGRPAEYLNVLDGQAKGVGPVGFSAALLPLFGATEFAQEQRARIKDAEIDQLGYYSLALLLFGQGWEESRYAFSSTGYLEPNWTRCE